MGGGRSAVAVVPPETPEFIEMGLQCSIPRCPCLKIGTTGLGPDKGDLVRRRGRRLASSEIEATTREGGIGVRRHATIDGDSLVTERDGRRRRTFHPPIARVG